MSNSLVVDARWLKTGIGRYTLSLMQDLRNSLPGLDIACITQPQYAEMLSGLCDRVIISKTGIYSLREQLLLPWLAREFSAFYAPHYNIPLFWDKKLLATIHDLNHLLDSSYRTSWKAQLYAKPVLKLAVEKADVIVTPSSYTKRMIQEHLYVEPDRITVIPCPVSEIFRVYDKSESRIAVAKNHGIVQPFILFVGNLAPNKNIPTLLNAFLRLRQLRQDAPLLVMVGEGKCREELLAHASTLHVENAIVWLESLSDSLLARLYAAAVMTIMPSFEEGFGLPVVESMACGTPVICSKTASLPEIAEGAAIFFDPYSSEELAETICNLLDSSENQEKAINSGIKKAQVFSQKAFSERQALAIHQLLMTA